jgi:hypothetical protein
VIWIKAAEGLTSIRLSEIACERQNYMEEVSQLLVVFIVVVSVQADGNRHRRSARDFVHEKVEYVFPACVNNRGRK